MSSDDHNELMDKLIEMDEKFEEKLEYIYQLLVSMAEAQGFEVEFTPDEEEWN